MKKSLVLGMFLTALAFNSCSKKKEEVSPKPLTFCDSYVPGDVAVGLTDGARVTGVFEWINSLGLAINQINGFDYVSSLPPDSLTYVNKLLLTKPYLNAKGFNGYAFISALDHKIHTTSNLFNMNAANQADWRQTMQAIQLAEETVPRCQGCKDMYLGVPSGEEKKWAQELTQNPAARWVELNCIIPVNPQ